MKQRIMFYELVFTTYLGSKFKAISQFELIERQNEKMKIENQSLFCANLRELCVEK